jgi:hypothetical protein
MRRRGINGGPNFIDWFPIHVQSSCDIFSSSYVQTYCDIHVQTSYPFQCTKVADIHDDLRKISYGSVIVRSYGRYDVNGFRFWSSPFEATRPQVAIVNSGVVNRAINKKGQEINYYGIIQQILEFNFVGHKELNVVFFICNWFNSIHGIQHNKYGMIEIEHNSKLPGNDDVILAHQGEHVYYLNYPCQKLAAWWVVYKVNPREWLYTPTDATYHFDDRQVDEIYQEEEMPTSFVVEPGAALDSLDADGGDVTVLQKQK